MPTSLSTSLLDFKIQSSDCIWVASKCLDQKNLFIRFKQNYLYNSRRQCQTYHLICLLLSLLLALSSTVYSLILVFQNKLLPFFRRTICSTLFQKTTKTKLKIKQLKPIVKCDQLMAYEGDHIHSKQNEFSKPNKNQFILFKHQAQIPSSVHTQVYK